VSRVAVVIPAGGAGHRMGGVLKPFLELAGEPVLAHCLRPFLQRPDVHWVVVAVPPAVLADPPRWLTADHRVLLVAGGAERGESVRNAVAAIPGDADIILVHDAARPLVSADVIARCVDAAAAGASVVAAIPVADTIKVVDGDGTITATPDRSSLRAAQTPQAFPAAVLRSAFARAGADAFTATDDAALVARYGTPVAVVDGAPQNLKITTATDLAVAEALIAARPPAPGMQ
jgi:2-C-methyl-D-erythritol 4-phosphate cytidylyltransferase